MGHFYFYNSITDFYTIFFAFTTAKQCDTTT